MSDVKRVALPEFEPPPRPVEISAEIYRDRIAAAARCMRDRGLDVLVVYGDREHFANLAYLTGFDPRFEEALLLLHADGRGKLLLGNECMGYLPDDAIGLDVELFQELSLLGQQRDSSRPLRTILTDFGVRSGRRVGCAGWKYFDADSSLVEGGAAAIEIPAYIVDLLRDATGNDVVNAGDIFMGVSDGLRTTNEPEQIAQFEFAAGCTSAGVLALMRALTPGSVEADLESLLAARGLPLSCHRMVSVGAKASRGLASASENVAKSGDPYTTAFGLCGALTCRAGMIARSRDALAPDVADFYDAYVRNYFDVVATWYQNVRVGAVGGDVFAAVEAVRDGQLYDLAVNPGHYLHLDEWVHSPFSPGSGVSLRSGMALQMDIIPISRGPLCCSNAEDGIVLADADLRKVLADRYPDLWARTQARRAFMQSALGIELHESVLPTSNLPAYLPPYVMDMDSALTLQ